MFWYIMIITGILMYRQLKQGRIQDFWKGGGSILGLQAKKRGVQEGTNFGPNVKKPT